MVKKLMVVLLLLVALALSGCSGADGVSPIKPGSEPAKAVEQKPAEIKTTEITVYRAPKNGEQKLVAERVRYAMGNKSKEEAALDALLNTAPTSKTLQNLFPAGTKLRGVTVKNGIAYVDFNQAFAKKVPGSYTQLMMVNAVVATLTENPEVKKVQFLVEGKKLTVLGQLDMADPLTRNQTLLK